MRIKRFGESFRFRMSEDVDHEYIRNCFADFIDAGAHVSAFDRLADEYPDLRMRMDAGDSSVSITITRG